MKTGDKFKKSYTEVFRFTCTLEGRSMRSSIKLF